MARWRAYMGQTQKPKLGGVIVGREKEPDPDARPDSELLQLQLLWACALEQCIADSCALGCDPTAVAARRQARTYLRGGGPDLRFVLDVCNLDLGCWFARCLPELEARWLAVDARLRPPPPRLQKRGQASRQRAARARSEAGGYLDTPEAARAS